MSTKLRENRNPNRETPELGRVRAAAPRTGGGAGPTGGGVPSDAAQRFTATLTPTWLQCDLARRVLRLTQSGMRWHPSSPLPAQRRGWSCRARLLAPRCTRSVMVSPSERCVSRASARSPSWLDAFTPPKRSSRSPTATPAAAAGPPSATASLSANGCTSPASTTSIGTGAVDVPSAGGVVPVAAAVPGAVGGGGGG